MNDAVRKVIARLREKPERLHLFVYHYDVGTFHVPATEAMERTARRFPLDMAEVTARDDAALDEITAIDEWRITKAWSLKSLAEGWRCYVARHDDQIVGVMWVRVGGRFSDSALERELTLGPDESFFVRTYTVPRSRGRGVLPHLTVHAVADLARTAGATHGLTATRSTNRVLQNTLAAMGVARVGTIGYVGLFGMRLHYLWGRKTFPHTRRRFYLDLRRFSDHR